VVSGLISRARARGNDIRFAQRERRPGQTRQQRLELDRVRKARKRQGLPPLSIARPLADVAPVVARPVVEARETETPNIDPPLNLPLWELEGGMCRFAVNEVPVGRGLDLRFCGRPVVRGQFCEACASRAYDPKGAARRGGKFALPTVTAKLGPR
jgi:hypothetical protein